MKFLKKLLMMMFLLPVLPLFGMADGGDEGAGEVGGDTSKNAEGQEDEPEKEEESSKEVTMKQSELDAIINRAFKKGARKAGAEKKPVEENAPDQTEQLTKAIQRAASAEVRAAMAVSGIKPERIERACRLIDIDSVLTNGEVDKDLLDGELEALLKDFPELKQTVTEPAAGFKIGAEMKKQEKSNQDSEISKIFGVTKT